MRRNKKKKIIIIGLIGILALMTAGYAAFQTNLNIKGTSKVSSNWNVLITNVTESNKEGDAETVGTPSWTDLTAYMEANLYQKGDFVEYDVTVENRGTLDAKLESITDNIKSSNEAVKITFSGYTKGGKLEKGQSQIIKVKIEYNPDFTGTIEEGSGEVSIDLNYTQNDDYTKDEGGDIISPDRYLVTYDCTTNGGKDCTKYNEYLKEGETVNLLYQGTNNNHKFIGWNTDKVSEEGLTELQMKAEDITLYAIYEKDPIIRSWASTDTTDFHSEAYKQSIISVDFLDNKNIPETAVESWDVSEKKDKSVMAWVIPDTTDNTKHHLYIGGKGGVIANEDSSRLFYNFINIQSIEFNDNFDTSNTTNMSFMFNRCTVLSNLNLSGFNTSKVTNMSYMFTVLDNLTSLNLSDFDTSNVTNMAYMFAYDSSLKNIIGLENFDTSKTTNIEGMFGHCSSLTKLNLCSFNTLNVTSKMDWMFAATSNLEKVYVGPSWKVSDITSENNMWEKSKISAVTQSNNCMIDAEDPATLSFTTTKTTNSITVVATATSESGIAKYEYSKEGGSTWEEGDAMHTLTGLTQGTEYSIKVRVTSKVGKQTVSEITKVTTNTLKTPTFTDGNLETTITYEEGCGDTLTCTYKYNDKEEVEVTNKSVTVPITEAGNIVAKITDGKNIETSSHIILYNDLYVSNTGNNETGYGTLEKPYATLNKAYSMATESSNIKVMDNITANETTTFNQNKNITLTSDGSTNNSIIRGDGLTDAVLNITTGTLNMNDITIDGNNIEAQSALVVSVGNLITKNGTIIQNNKNVYVPPTDTDYTRIGGGICIYGGTALIENTKILNNSMSGSDIGGGGGIYTYFDTKLTVNNSVISNNYVSRFGAGIAANADVTIKASEISNNTAERSGGGVSHGIGTLKIQEGTKINNNTASSYGGGIVAMNNSNILIENATISNNTTVLGGGIRLIGTSNQKLKLEISGNTLIDGNQAERFGGGIYTTFSDIVMKGGTISNNSTNSKYYPVENGSYGDGGAINMDNSTLNMSGGIITKNQGRNGFGIAIFSASTFTMTGGTISDNAGHRGAICLYSGSQFILNGGTIKNNKATALSDGGISIDNSSGTNKYTYQAGVVCGNTPTNSYETHSTCPTS